MISPDLIRDFPGPNPGFAGLFLVPAWGNPRIARPMTGTRQDGRGEVYVMSNQASRPFVIYGFVLRVAPVARK